MIDNVVDNILKAQAFRLKGRLYALTVMHIISSDCEFLLHQLRESARNAPRLFDRTPLILDCSALIGNSFDLALLCRYLRDYSLIPLAVQGADAEMASLAQTLGLAVINATLSHGKTRRELKLEEQAIKSGTLTELKLVNTKILNAPVRSGQQVVSKGGDLVITAAVGHGAELLAEGNIHVYGALRGRALAGIAGNKSARIFCQSLDAELLSIAGHYRLSDTIEPVAVPCQVYLQDDHIQIEVL